MDPFATLGLPCPATRARGHPPSGALASVPAPGGPHAAAVGVLEPASIRHRGPALNDAPCYALDVLRGERWRTLVARVGPSGATLRHRRDGGGTSARFEILGDALHVVDLGLGVARQIVAPVSLVDGTRIRLGRRAIVLRMSEPTTGLMSRATSTGGPGGGAARVVEIRPDGSEGRRFLIGEGVVVVGRKRSEADIALSDDPLISARHLRIRRDGDAYVAEDLASRNGSYLALTGRHLVAPGEVLLVGSTRVRVTTPDPDFPRYSR